MRSRATKDAHGHRGRGWPGADRRRVGSGR